MLSKNVNLKTFYHNITLAASTKAICHESIPDENTVPIYVINSKTHLNRNAGM